jgi:hypothetical protein
VREFKARIIDAQERLKELDLYIKECKDKKGHYQKINSLNKDLELDIGNLKDFLTTLPTEIQHMLASLEEMKLGSDPDNTADYFEKKQDILFKINSLKDIQKKI